MTKNGHNCSSFVPPRSLKDLLDFFDKLQVPENGTNGKTSGAEEFTKKVFEEINKRLRGDNNNGWVRDGPDLFSTNSGANGTGHMPKTIKGLEKLRDNILNGNGQKDKYNDFAKNAHDPCVKKYADAILSNAFPLFGCLFYLWFMCDNKEAANLRPNGFRDGWTARKLKGGTDLNKFLTDKQPTEGQNSVPMLPRGYDSENDLKSNSNNGNTLFNTDNHFNLFDIGSADMYVAHLQQALFFFLFLAPRWHPAMSGHALLFLEWFNNKASTDFKDVQWLDVKDAGTTFFDKNCNSNGLEKAIQELAKGSNGNGPNISPVYKVSIGKNGYGHGCNLYSPGEKNKCDAHSNNNGGCGQTILHNTSSFKDNDKKAHVFMQYVSWLWWCIPHLTASLKEMSADSVNWKNGTDNNPFKDSSSFGPFAFGFTFSSRYHITCMT